MKWLRLCFVLSILTCTTCHAMQAKRAPAPQVAPIFYKGLKFIAPNTPQTMGYVEAWDVGANKKVWEKKVYTVFLHPFIYRMKQIISRMEQGYPQDVFISSLDIKNDILHVGDERGRAYTVKIPPQILYENRRLLQDKNGFYQEQPSAAKELELLRSKISDMESRYTPNRGMQKEEVEEIFGPGRGVGALAKNGSLPPDGKHYIYTLCQDGELYVTYDNNVVKQANFLDPFSTKGRPAGVPVPVEELLTEARHRYKQLQIIGSAYNEKTKELARNDDIIIREAKAIASKVAALKERYPHFKECTLKNLRIYSPDGKIDPAFSYSYHMKDAANPHYIPGKKIPNRIRVPSEPDGIELGIGFWKHPHRAGAPNLYWGTLNSGYTIDADMEGGNEDIKKDVIRIIKEHERKSIYGGAG